MHMGVLVLVRVIFNQCVTYHVGELIPGGFGESPRDGGGEGHILGTLRGEGFGSLARQP
jgi:hypothetical protein